MSSNYYVNLFFLNINKIIVLP